MFEARFQTFRLVYRLWQIATRKGRVRKKGLWIATFSLVSYRRNNKTSAHKPCRLGKVVCVALLDSFAACSLFEMVIWYTTFRFSSSNLTRTKKPRIWWKAEWLFWHWSLSQGFRGRILTPIHTWIMYDWNGSNGTIVRINPCVVSYVPLKSFRNF